MEEYSLPKTPPPYISLTTLPPTTTGIQHEQQGRIPVSPEQPRTVTLVQPPRKKKKKKKHRANALRSIFRSFPILIPPCKLPLPNLLHGVRLMSAEPHKEVMGSGRRITGTLFGYKSGRVTFSLQEIPRCLPSLVLELGIQMSAIQRELSTGMVRIVLECENRPLGDKPRKLLEEPIWTMNCNGKKTGYGTLREATPIDLNIMELLKVVSMGVGVIPFSIATNINSACKRLDYGGEDVKELVYMRAFFEHVVGSKDSESFYMLSPNGNSELTIFFVRA